jgi:hypothetical protein
LCPFQRPASVDLENLAGDEGCIRRGQEDHGAGHILGLRYLRIGMTLPQFSS